MDEERKDSLTVTPIGYARTEIRAKFDSPPQPDSAKVEVNRIELLPGRQYELALQDLAGFDRIWVIWWFHRSQHWRPRVLPPRGPAVRRGVFATRSPHRPNPIGMTCVPLLGVNGLVLEVGPLDLVDGTPILDIKPYLTTVDVYSDACLGWLEAVEAAEREGIPYQVDLSPVAQAQMDWLKDQWGIEIMERALQILTRDPTPHRTRRILRLADGRLRMACGAWRLFYTLEGRQVQIESVGKGYSDESLNAPGHERILDREAQIEFGLKYPNSTHQDR